MLNWPSSDVAHEGRTERFNFVPVKQKKLKNGPLYHSLLAFGRRSTGPMSEEFFGLVERTRNDMNADEFADAPGSNGTRFGRGFNRSNIATHEDRDVAIKEIFFANQNDVGRFYHRVGSLDSPYKAAGLYQSQRLVHFSSLLVQRGTVPRSRHKSN